MSNFAAQMSLYATAQISSLVPSLTITSASADPQIVGTGIQVALRAQSEGPVNDIAFSRSYPGLPEFLADLLAEHGSAVHQVVEQAQAEPVAEKPEPEPVEPVVEDEPEVEVEEVVEEQDQAVDAAASAALSRVRAAVQEQEQDEEQDKPAPRRRSRKAEKEAKAAAAQAEQAPVALGDDEF